MEFFSSVCIFRYFHLFLKLEEQTKVHLNNASMKCLNFVNMVGLAINYFFHTLNNNYISKNDFIFFHEYGPKHRNKSLIFSSWF